MAELDALWSGELVLFTSRTSLVGQLAKFDFSWFVPAIVKYRKLLIEVLAVSLVLQLFALVTPLFFQVVNDVRTLSAMAAMAPPAGATSWGALTAQQQSQLNALGVWS